MLPQTELCLFGFFTSSSVTRLNLARVPRLTSDNCTCCHTDSERGDHDFCLSRSHYGRVSTKTETTRPGPFIVGSFPFCVSTYLVCLFGFLTSSSTTRLYRGRAPRQERLTILRAATHETELGDHDFCLTLYRHRPNL